MNRACICAATLLLTACGGAQGSATQPAPESVMNMKQPWEVFPPEWHVGDAWEVESTTSQRSWVNRELRKVTGTSVYRVVEVPRQAGGRYLVRVESTTPGRQDVYWLSFRDDDFGCAEAFLDLNGDPLSRQSFSRPHAEGGPFLALLTEEYGAEIVFDFPVRPDPAHPWDALEVPGKELVYQVGYRTQEMAYDGTGVTFTLQEWSSFAGGRKVGAPRIRTIVRWRPGEPWWAEIERFESAFGQSSITAHARLLRVLSHGQGADAPR